MPKRKPDAIERKSSAPLSHPEKLTGSKLKGAFGYALEQVFPPPIAKQTVLAFFDYRASYEAIIAWRYGLCKAPPWAIVKLTSCLDRDASRLAQLRSQLTAVTGQGRPGDLTGRNILAWRARQARERDQKKKGSS